MRKCFTIITTILLISAAGCQQNNQAEAILKDEEDRREVYTAILENEERRNEMMAMMRERNTNGMMGHGNMMGDDAGNRKQMQDHMQQMMALCKTDTAACNMLSQMMVQNRDLMGNMMRHMQQRGLIDSTCIRQMRLRDNP